MEWQSSWIVGVSVCDFASENPEDGEMYLLVPAHPGCHGKVHRAVKWLCVCVVCDGVLTVQTDNTQSLLCMQCIYHNYPVQLTTNKYMYLQIIVVTVVLLQSSHSRSLTLTHARTHAHTHNCFMALWILSRTTWVSWYQKKHSPTHTYRGHQSPLICFIHLIRSMASSLFNPRTSLATNAVSACLDNTDHLFLLLDQQILALSIRVLKFPLKPLVTW